MESHNYLGIYVSKNTATAVCISSQSGGANIIGRFSVSAEESDQAKMQTLANRIAQGCSERNLSFSEVAVALDCALFMQHGVQSEFNDTKQIAATIRFDTEEALATDITDVALAFEIASTNESGSNLTVFTAQRKILSEVLIALQEYNLDPITMEPDVKCLSRYLNTNISEDQIRQGTLFALLSSRSGYLIIPPPTGSDSRKSSIVRTFLIGPKQKRTELLTREVLMTLALAQSNGSINSLSVFDSKGTVDEKILSQKVGLEVTDVACFETYQISSQTPADAIDHVDFAVGCGAALSLLEKEHKVNFRDDFHPYEGKKIKMLNALKFAAISITVLLLAVGLYFQRDLFNTSRDIGALRNKLAQDYFAVTQKNLSAGADISAIVKDLSSIRRRLEAEKKGLIADETSVLSKLTLVLKAFNKCAAKTDLNLKKLMISRQNITITGDTSSRDNTKFFFDVLGESGLELLKDNYHIEGNRDNFSISVAPKK
ncbi:MAG: hypothetical protein JW715_00875 [Sedimentisphaerales bacterium]|nr:hypothetical protein [Sedimentisphaerales bacterium]